MFEFSRELLDPELIGARDLVKTDFYWGEVVASTVHVVVGSRLPILLLERFVDALIGPVIIDKRLLFFFLYV